MAGTTKAQIALRADNRKLRGDLRKTRRMFGKAGAGIKRAFSGVLSPLGVGAGALGFAAIGKEVVDFEEKLARLEIQSRGAIDASAFREKANEISRATSMSRESVLESARAFVSMTGDAKGANDMLELFAKASIASGTGAEDIARMASGLQQTMNIDPKNMEQAFSIILSGGKTGSIEMREMAAIIGGLAPQFTRFGQRGAEGLAVLNAALQTIAPEFNNKSAEAATGMNAFMGAIEKNAARIKKNLGFSVYNKDGSLKDLRTLVTQFGKAEGKGKNLFKALGPKEAVKTVRALQGNLEKWDEITESQKGANDVSEDYAKIQQSSAVKMKKAFNEMKLAIVETVTPERIERFVEMLEKVAKLVGWAVDNAYLLGAAFAAIKLAPLIAGFTTMAGQLAGMAASSGIVGAMAGGAGIKGAIGGGIKALGGTAAAAGGAVTAGALALAGGAGVLTGRAIDNKLDISGRASSHFADKKVDDHGFIKDSIRKGANGNDRSARIAFNFANREGLLKDGKVTAKGQGQLSDSLAKALEKIAVDVNVRVDEKGLLKAEANTRRSPQ